MTRNRIMQWRRYSILSLALFILFGVVPLSAQAADNEQPRFLVDRYSAPSLGQGKEMTYRIYLPEGYYNSNQRYPVVYLLHSEGESSRQFADDDLQGKLDQWVAQGAIQKMIVVMPDTAGDSWFVNQTNGQWDDLITKDLVPAIDARYNTINLPAYRGISGISMGGYGAFEIGLRHPELFSSIASHMGSLAQAVDSVQSPLALIKTITTANLKKYAYYFDGGTDDPSTYAAGSTNDIHEYFRTNNIAHGYQTRPGIHDKSYYLTYLNRSFMMHGANFAKGMLTGSFTATPQAIGMNDTKVSVNFTVNLNRAAVSNAVYQGLPNSAFNLEVALKVTDPSSSGTLYATNTNLGNVVTNSSLSSFTGSFDVPVSVLGSLKNTNLTVDAKLLGVTATLGTKPLIRVTPTGTLPEDTLIDLYGDWKFTKDSYPNPRINGNTDDTSLWNVAQPGLDWWTDGFGGYAGLNSYTGGAWYVKDFYVPEDFPDADLTLMAGKIDDADMTYINGRLVGSTGFDATGNYTASFWAQSREYPIASSVLKKGEMNKIAVYMYNQNGGGGWYAGPIGIYSKAALQKAKNLPSKVPSNDVVATIKGLVGRQFAAIMNKDAKGYGETVAPQYFNAGVDKSALVASKQAWFDNYKSIDVKPESEYVFELDGRYLYTAQVTVTGTKADDSQQVIQQGAVTQFYAVVNGAALETGDQKLFYKSTYYSAALGKDMAFRIYLPPSYLSNPDKRYPSVYLFHQLNSDSESYAIDKIDQILNDGVKDGSMKDMIVVMPDSSGTSFWYNSPTAKWQDMVIKDLLPYVDSHYRTIDDARYRGTSGVSMGGFGSFTMGFTFPDLFSSVVSHMGALSYSFGGLDPRVIVKEYPIDALKQYAIYLDSGNLDSYKFDIPVNQLHQFLMNAGVPHIAEVRDGSHDSAFYTKSINRSFAMHSDHFASANVADGALSGGVTAVKADDSVAVGYKVTPTDLIQAYTYHREASKWVVDQDPGLSIPVALDVYDANNEKIASFDDRFDTKKVSELNGAVNVPQLTENGVYTIVLKASVLDRTFEIGRTTFDSNAGTGNPGENPGQNPGSNPGSNPGNNSGSIPVDNATPAETKGAVVTSVTDIQAAIDSHANLQLKSEDGNTLSIPYESLQQFMDAAGSKVKSLTWQVKPVDASASAALLQQGGNKLGGKLQIAGQFADLELTLQLEDGTTVPLNQAFKKPVTLTLKAAKNANPDLVGIYYWNAAGEPQYVGGKWNADGNVTVELSHFSRYGVLEFSKTFIDVPASNWSSKAVQALAAKQLITGVSADRFEPARSITRAEFAAMLVRVLGWNSETGNANPFSDVASGKWYANAVTSAYKHGLVKGVSADKFAPESTITREEMAVMIFNAYEQSGAVPTFDGSLDMLARFTDSGKIQAWAKEQMNALVQLGLLNGKSASIIAPAQSVTRAEAAQALYNWTKLSAK